jgi:hypothetical protein
MHTFDLYLFRFCVLQIRILSVFNEMDILHTWDADKKFSVWLSHQSRKLLFASFNSVALSVKATEGFNFKTVFRKRTFRAVLIDRNDKTYWCHSRLLSRRRIGNSLSSGDIDPGIFASRFLSEKIWEYVNNTVNQAVLQIQSTKNTSGVQIFLMHCR